MDDEKMECAVCKAPAKSRCGGCQKIGYCGKEHQKAHWKQHKGQCCAWKVCENPELGRYLSAARDIKAGEIVIKERPLLVTPPKITLPVCLGCYSEFSLEGSDTDDGKGVRPYVCRNGCSWPMCKSSACSNSKDHESECKLAKACGKVTIKTVDCEHPLYQSIGLLRVLGLKDKDPSSYDKLMSLEANQDKRESQHAAMERELEGTSGVSALDTKHEVCVKLIQDLFQRPDVTENWIRKTLGIIETNGHEIPIPNQDDGHINRRVIGVYHIASLLEHNCTPNCVKTFELSTKEIVIRSSLPIKKGEHISICYVDPLWGTKDRVTLLELSKFFQCSCDRCKDPTELGCHISSLKCQHLKCLKSGEGYIIPTNPFKHEAEWKCTNCGEEYNLQYVGSLLQKAGEELEQLHEKIGDIQAKEEYLKRFSNTLAPNHFYFLEVKMELAQLYGRTSDDPLHQMAPKKLLRKIQICEELLEAFAVIAPGYNRLRALVLYELQAAVLILSRLRQAVGEISTEKHLDELMQCGKWMTEVIKVLGWESQNSIERRRADGCQRDLDALRESVLSLQTEPEEKKQDSSKITKQDTSTTSRSHLSVDEDSFIEEVF